MGWDYGTYQSMRDLTDHLTRTWIAGNADIHTCLERKQVNIRHLWTLWRRQLHDGTEETEIVLYLLDWNAKTQQGGYKGIPARQHPFYYDCPLDFLSKTPVEHAEWRAKVQEYHARQQRQFTLGEVIPLRGCTIPAVKITNIKPLRGQYMGKTYRLPKSLIA